jgi:tetratricopeptide (TPR) repeat protein
MIDQFEMLLCLIALEVHQSNDTASQTAAPSSGGRIVLGTNSSAEETSMSTIIAEFLAKSKIVDHPTGEPRRSDKKAPNKSSKTDYNSSDESIDEPQSPLLSANCVDEYTGSLKHSRQAMLFRMQKLFDSVELYLRESNLTNRGPSQALTSLIRNNRDQETLFNSRQRFASKPVVIGDSVPLPACPSPVEQLLHSALAHHNLGSFEETILFLDAAKREFQDLKRARKEGSQDDIIELPVNFEMYVLLSKGNLYRSCGEDERAMLCYIEGWDISKEHQGADWEVIFINSIGVLAYYLVRYDIALMCFDRVVRYREEEYGSDSSDTATALNNEGCSLFGMNERGEARLRFERSWLVGKKLISAV